MISGSGTNPKLTEQASRTLPRRRARDDQQGPAVAQFLQSMKSKKAAVVDDATAYGEGARQRGREDAEGRGRADRRAASKTNDQGHRLQGYPHK